MHCKYIQRKDSGSAVEPLCFEKIQWFTTDHASLYFLPVKIVILALFYM